MASHVHPFVKGFRRGLRADPNSIKSLAQAYQVSERTVLKWKANKVNVTDPRAVAAHLLSMKSPSLAAVRAVGQLIS